MELEAFQSLPPPEVARLVRAGGLRVCVFPMNGTRRWFALEHADKAEASIEAYIDVATQNHLAICRLLFDHGLETLLAPTFSTHIQIRGADYMPVAAQALSRLATHPAYLDFYQRYGVRVRFYGEYRKFLAGTPQAYLADQFDAITVQTQKHARHRLFYGVFAQDAIESAAELSVRFYQEHGRAPDKRELVERYYGEPLPPIDMFIGFSKFRAFDFGMAATGREALYFTVSPSPYLTQRQWRDILYDYLYARRGPKLDPASLPPEAQSRMREFYRTNQGRTIGVGAYDPRLGFWYPLPQIDVPARMAPEREAGDPALNG